MLIEVKIGYQCAFNKERAEQLIVNTNQMPLNEERQVVSSRLRSSACDVPGTVAVVDVATVLGGAIDLDLNPFARRRRGGGRRRIDGGRRFVSGRCAQGPDQTDDEQ